MLQLHVFVSARGHVLYVMRRGSRRQNVRNCHEVRLFVWTWFLEGPRGMEEFVTFGLLSLEVARGYWL